MNTFRDYSFRVHGEVYTLMDKVFRSFGFKYYLIGAAARDVHLYRAESLPVRGTADIDFAVMVPDIGSYEELMTNFLEQGFEETQIKHRVIYRKTDTVIDLLPYGEIAQQYTVDFDERDLELSVLGFQEVGDEIDNFRVSAQLSIPVSSLHGLIILKLISWNQKKDRNKDLRDIKSLLDAAWELYQDELFTENSAHFDLLEIKPFDTDIAAARIVGRKIRSVLDECEPLKNEIIDILRKEIEDPAEMVVIMSQDYSATEKVIEQLQGLWNGIND